MSVTSRQVFRKSEVSMLVLHQSRRLMAAQHQPPPLSDISGSLIFSFSWLLVMSVGLMPLVEGALDRSPSITMPTTIAFLVAVGSAVLLRRRYSWIGLVLHIFGQIAIWLSLFVMSLAVVLVLLSSG
jgi:hypothetical protein